MLRLRTFGGLSLESDRGALAGAAAQRRRLALLAVLATGRDGGITRDKLVGLLWPEVDDARARAALSQALYTLKRDSETADLVIGQEQLVLNLRAVACDLLDFEDALARGDVGLAAGLYRGPFLDGVHLENAPEFEHWLDGVRLGAAQAAERAIERLAVDAEERADHAGAVEWWRRLASLDPLRTRAVAGLMRAMVSQGGDRAGAIREAERYAQRVHDEVGQEPRDAVTELASELRAEGLAQRVPTALPLVGDELIGREAELRAACALIVRPTVALVTLTGHGGTGKTRLAIQMARQLESGFDRVCFVDLSQVRERTAVIPAIASALAVQPHGGRDVLESLAAACAGRRTLIVLDNFEQVVSAAPALTRLAAAAPGVRLLVTSRMRLGVRAEHEFFVAPLAVPDERADAAALRENAAVRLFVRRASNANPALTWDHDALRAAARVCMRLDGLPLAIELAAARCRLMSPSALAARLEDGFELLSGGSRDMPERHRTIRRTVAWSVALLGPDEKRLWARLAIFAGGCTLPTAEAVCAGADESLAVLDGVSALLDANLLIREMPARGEPRLRMLETVREFALEKLAQDPGASAVRRRHGDWYRHFVQSLAPTLTGEAQREALATLGSEHANLGAALEHAIASGEVSAAVALGAALWRYWLVRGFLAEGHAWLMQILAMPGASDPALETGRADVMTGAGHIAQNTGAVEEAAQHFRAVLEIRRRVGDRAGQARTLADLGWIAWRRCDFPDARRLSTECLALAQELGATRVAALAFTNLGAAALFEGNVHEAQQAFARSAELRAAVADRRGVAFANTFLGWATCRAGDLTRASELLESAEATLRELGDERLVYFARDTRAEVYLRAGDASRAARILDLDAIGRGRRFGDRWSVAHGLALASWASRELGRAEQAVAFATESLELRRAEGDRYGEAECLALLAAATPATGDDVTAVELLHESRAIRVAIGDRAGVAECDAALVSLATHV